jgi:CRP-like cAMP-binding protein
MVKPAVFPLMRVNFWIAHETAEFPFRQVAEAVSREELLPRPERSVAAIARNLLPAGDWKVRAVIGAHLRKLRARTDITNGDEATIREIMPGIQRIPAHSLIARAGDLRDHSVLIVDGWIARSKDLPEGRVVAGLSLPGDYADLHGLTLRRIDHDLVALTDCKVAMVPHASLCELFERCPKLAWLYWFGTNSDAAMHREWAASFGKRSTLRRIAHLFCEIYLRLDVVRLPTAHPASFR